MNDSDKKRQIYDATLELIAEFGFHGTSMSKIVKKAGVSAGIVYHYFESKDHLIRELYKETKRSFVQDLVDEMDKSAPLAIQMRQMVEIMFRRSLNNPHENQFFQQFATSPYYDDKMRCDMEECFSYVETIVTKAKEEKIIKDLPGIVLGVLTMDVAAALAMKKSVCSELELNEDLIQMILDSIWAAIRL